MTGSDVDYVRVVDSHTGGEPTRVVVSGGPDLGAGPIATRAERFRTAHDTFRSAVVNEPRGSDVMVGALLLAPHDVDSIAGVIFFNNIATLGMCGHGAIGIVTTLAYLGRIGPGSYAIETPVGRVRTTLHEDGSVSVRNVPAYRYLQGVHVQVDGVGAVTGDVAWGGNWFFLVEDHGRQIALSNVEQLTDYTWRIRKALANSGITGRDDAEIDHIELCTHASDLDIDSRNFVLCPGKSYDRSPCGTGTSAKIACLAAEGKLAPGETWRQESIIGSLFEATYELEDGLVVPTITGRAYVNADSTLILNPADPFCWGIRAT